MIAQFGITVEHPRPRNGDPSAAARVWAGESGAADGASTPSMFRLIRRIYRWLVGPSPLHPLPPTKWEVTDARLQQDPRSGNWSLLLTKKAHNGRRKYTRRTDLP